MTRVVVGITGASGAIYGVRLLERLREAEVETHLVATRWARVTIEHETGRSFGEVKELETQRERLKTQLAVIEKLEKGKRGPVRVLDELSQALPKRVWINSFREGGGSLSMTGTAIDNADISEFLRALGKSAYFSNIQLKFTQNNTIEGTQVYNFEIGCNVNYQA